MILINGNRKDQYAGVSLQEMLTQEQYAADKVVVERNGRIVTRRDFAGEILTGNEEIEVVTFVGGG